MDPQQRQILQVAYQAVEQSGYLNKLSDDEASTESRQDANVGCFLGVCLSDYDSNVSTHPANAFTATGNLQGFIAGRVSHFFGWTGPGLTIDTACSSSLVAIHQACNSILAGECTAALAGGSHIMSSAGWFQNLAAGSFLSPTGACKPFDAAADGYCRGEGIGAVFLKKMSAALEDGDQILGVIGATAVQQNQNTTPIFVPNTSSLSSLLTNVTRKANVKPSSVSYVEAHGTGTPVGDPAEYGSIRDVFGGPQRMGQPLFLGSVKGLVGHMECTSGIISLIKVLLMINKGVLPKQASFNEVNPALNKRPEDLITIPTQPHLWDARQRVAVINNYGASGSNASMVVLEPPGHRETRHRLASASLPSPTPSLIPARHPFWFSGADAKSLVRYAAEFRKYLDNIGDAVSIADISYHLAHQSNRTLDQALFFTAKSMSELKAALQTVKNQTQPTSSSPAPTAILCFGGQTSTFVGLDKQVYDNVALLRTHLNAVDAAVQSLGHRSIYPDIFQSSSIKDVVQLQTLLFALQYACARCWMDCGVRPAALVGHSFGELTALAVSGILSLKDAISMIRNRATVIRELWGKDAGAMMAIEGDLDDVESLLRRANGEHEGIPASVACYNGRRSFTVAGSTEAVDAVAAELSSVTSSGQAVFKSKRLKVTNAFHSALVDPLLDSLEESARTLTFREPSIWIESATKTATSVLKPTAKYIASHMREPVYFGHAIERLEARYGSKPCVFLEAGSSSTVTAMAARVLASTKTRHSHTFQGLNILGSGNGLNNLADSTLSLWKAGLRVQHWQHHGAQQKLNLVETTLLLPPYQFDPDSRHWLELREPPEVPAPPISSAEAGDKAENDTAMLHHWESHADKNHVRAVFRLNTSHEKYAQLLSGHLTIQTAPICPATIQLGFVIDAIGTLEAKYKQASFQPQIRNVKYHSPVCANRSLTTWIEVVCEQRHEVAAKWDFEVFSNDRSLNDPSQARASHTTGQISFAGSACPNVKHQLDVFQRLFTHQRTTDLLKRSDADEILTNRSIYRLFAEIVDYGDEFKGLQKIVSHGNEVAGHVVRKVSSFLDPRNPDAGFDAHLVDTFCQLGGLFANSLTDREPDKVYLANGIDQWIRAPITSIAKEFHVLATIHRATDRIFQADVFAFDAVTGALTEVILGVSYAKIPKAFMEKLLVRSTDAAWLTPLARASSADNAVAIPAPDAVLQPARRQPGPTLSEVTSQAAPKHAHAQQNAGEGLQLIDAAVSKIKNVVAELSGLEIGEIKDDSFLADLGIDSLVGMELINELNTTLKVKLPEEEAFAVVTMTELLDCVLKALGLSRGAQSSESSEYGNTSSSSNASSHGDDSDSTPSSSHPQSEADVAKPSPELSNHTGSSSPSCLPSTIANAFKEIQAQSDAFVVASNQEEYLATCFPRQNELAVAWTLDALEALGAGILEAKPGQQIQIIEHKEEHRKLVAHLYRAIQNETQLIKIDGDVITRTAVPPSISPSAEIYDRIRTEFPDQDPATKLIHYVGANLRSVLSGEVDGVKLIFGSQEGRELVSAFYADWPLNRVLYSQMIEFLSRALSDLSAQGAASGITKSNPLRVMEIGGGTGGTTKQIVPMLAALKLPIEYTFTDLSPSFVAAARKRWAKQYPWMRFRAHDAESAPDEDDSDSLLGSQHLVVASNVIHATRSIRKTTANVHKILRPDGFLLMLEMTRQPYWVDLIFGLFEGWWYFEDGRSHVLTHETTWKTEMQLAGYGDVQWTGGHLPETDIEKLILASADLETS